MELPRRFGSVTDLGDDASAIVPAVPVLEPVNEPHLEVVDVSSAASVVECPASVNAIAWSEAGSLAAACSDGSVLHAATGRDIGRALPATSPARALSWLGSGDLLATGYDDGDARAWIVDAASAVLVGEEARPRPVRALAWAPFSGVLALASGERIELWVMPDNARLLDQKAHDHDVTSLVWSPDGHTLASASRDRTIALWELRGESLVRRATLLGHEASVYALAWSPDGETLASGSGDCTVRLWDPATGGQRVVLGGHRAWVDALAWSPDSVLLASGGGDKRVHLWDVEHEERLVPALHGHAGTVLALAWSRDGTLLASGSDDATIRCWALPAVRVLARYSGHGDLASQPAWSPDGSAVASRGDDDTVRIWDGETGAAMTVVDDETTDNVRALAWSSDGATLTWTDERRQVCARELPWGRTRVVLPGPVGWGDALAWSPDGARLATSGDDDAVWIWDVERRRRVLTLDGHTDAVDQVAWSPDGRRLATAARDGVVRVWDAHDGTSLGVLTWHDWWVLALAWSPDGVWLASGSADTDACIWHVAADPLPDEPIFVLGDHTAWVGAVAWSGDGQYVATGSHDTTVRVWAAPTFARLGAGQTASSIGALWVSHDGTRVRAADDGRETGGRPVVYEFRVSAGHV